MEPESKKKERKKKKKKNRSSSSPSAPGPAPSTVTTLPFWGNDSDLHSTENVNNYPSINPSTADSDSEAPKVWIDVK